MSDGSKVLVGGAASLFGLAAVAAGIGAVTWLLLPFGEDGLTLPTGFWEAWVIVPALGAVLLAGGLLAAALVGRVFSEAASGMISGLSLGMALLAAGLMMVLYPTQLVVALVGGIHWCARCHGGTAVFGYDAFLIVLAAIGVFVANGFLLAWGGAPDDVPGTDEVKE